MSSRDRRAYAGLLSSALIFSVLVFAYWMSTKTSDMGHIPSSLGKTSSKNNDKDGQTDEWHYQYDTVMGFFLQDNSRTNPGTFDAMKENFGLIEQDYDTDTLLPANGKDLTQWQRFAHKLSIMNKKAAGGVSYRLLYLGRHGQGYHNVGQSFYGDDAWDCYYSTLHNDPHVPSVEFFDAHLTLLGEDQAIQVSKFWKRLMKAQKIPVPQTYYSSPLTRAAQTAELTFSSLDLPEAYPFKPLIKELLREGYGIHTCDSRPTRTYLQNTFPTFDIEDGLTETDKLYSATYREPPLAHTARLRRLLDDVFSTDDSTYISMTSHSGTIGATLRAVGHRSFMLPTGGAIPVLVRVKKVKGPRPDDGSKDEEWETKPGCVNDPKDAGLPGYRDIGEYIDHLERSIPKDEGDVDDATTAFNNRSRGKRVQ